MGWELILVVLIVASAVVLTAIKLIRQASGRDGCCDGCAKGGCTGCAPKPTAPAADRHDDR